MESTTTIITTTATFLHINCNNNKNYKNYNNIATMMKYIQPQIITTKTTLELQQQQ